MIQILPLNPADRPRWTDLWRDYLAFYDTTMPDAVYDHTWSRIMADTTMHGLAARDGAEILGITHFLFHESGWTLEPVCYLQDLFVTEAARGRGVGRALIEAVGDRARAQSSTRMYWLTQDHNATARLLYDRLANHSGFIRYEYKL